MWPHGLYSPWNSPGQNTGVGSLSLSRGSSQPRDQTQVSHFAGRFFTSWATWEAQEYWSGSNTGVGSLSLLQRIFPTQGLNPGLPHCRWILYQLRHKRNSRILEWLAYPFSSGSSWPRIWIRVFCIADGFLTSWATREAHNHSHYKFKCLLFWEQYLNCFSL